MNERITPPDWSVLDPNMCLNVSDAQLYFETYTDKVDENTHENNLEIINIDGRVTALEQSTPVGPGGKGAYLNLGGTPERYPTAQEMIEGDTPEETSFLVVARTDGIYFYNPKSKTLIPPKKGGGTVAIHASFPDIFDEGHTIKHDTRIGKSGVYTAKCSDVGLDGSFLSYDTVKILVVTTADMEYQTALHPDGTASRTFTAGNNVTPWSFHSGGTGGGGGNIDPVVIQEINRRLAALEAKPDAVGTFEALTDVSVDTVLDVNGLLYLGEDGKVRGGSVNPMLAMGYTPVQAASVGFNSAPFTGNVGALAVVASPVILMKGDLPQEVTLPNIVPFDTYKPSTTQIRAGRMSYFVNASTVEKTLVVSSGQRFYRDGNMDSAAVVVPAKTTFMYNPAIIDNGSGAMMECFVFIGQVQHQPGGGGSLGFTDLIDTPDTFVGQAGKSMIVKNDESGLEFIDSPEHAILTALEEGNLPIKWNNLKQKIAASSGNITANHIAENAFTLGLAGQASRFFYLPDIVDANTSPLPVDSVREGRLTIVSQQGAGTRTVALTAGCKFVVGGTTSAADLTIPPGQSWVLLPAIYGNGDKCWSVIGSFSSSPLYSDTGNGYVRSSSRSIMSSAVFQTTQINQSSLVHATLASNSGNSMRYTMFPEIVAWDHTGWIENHQVRLGKTLTVWGSSGGNMTLRPHSGQKWLIDNTTTTADITLSPGIMETYTAVNHDGDFKWMLMSRCKPNGAPVELEGIEARITVLENKPNPSFFELTNTPTTGRPGELIGYTMGGDAITSYARVSRMGDLSDVPADLTGNATKLLTVKTDESGYEFTDYPRIGPLTTRVDDIEDHQTQISLGNIPIGWNAMSAPLVMSSEDLTAGNLALNPVALATGTLSDKKFTLPNIMPRNSTTFTSTQVREGRIIYLANSSTRDRKIEVTANHLFNVGGVTSATARTIKTGITQVYQAGFIGGQKVWTYVGRFTIDGGTAYSLEAEDKLLARLDALEARLDALENKE